MSLADLTRVGRMWIPARDAGRMVIRRAVGGTAFTLRVPIAGPAQPASTPSAA